MGEQTGYLLVGPTGAKGRPLNVTRATNYYTIPVTQGATDSLRFHPPLLLNIDFRLLLRDRSLEHWLPPRSFFPSCPTWIRVSPKFLDHPLYLNSLSEIICIIYPDYSRVSMRRILFFKDSVRFELKKAKLTPKCHSKCAVQISRFPISDKSDF